MGIDNIGKVLGIGFKAACQKRKGNIFIIEKIGFLIYSILQAAFLLFLSSLIRPPHYYFLLDVPIVNFF